MGFFEMRPMQTDMVPSGSIRADRRLYLTKDLSRVVEEGDPGAAFLLANRGHPIHPDDAARLGLRVEGERIVWDAPPAVEEAPAPKQGKPAQNKQGKRAPNKAKG